MFFLSIAIIRTEFCQPTSGKVRGTMMNSAEKKSEAPPSPADAAAKLLVSYEVKVVPSGLTYTT